MALITDQMDLDQLAFCAWLALIAGRDPRLLNDSSPNSLAAEAFRHAEAFKIETERRAAASRTAEPAANERGTDYGQFSVE